VPLIVTDEGLTVRPEGELSDLAPTMLTLLGLPIPPELTGSTIATRA
jgi:2,3-bisphosphoglycerate-independent phosphoglycerate mutase